MNLASRLTNNFLCSILNAVGWVLWKVSHLNIRFCTNTFLQQWSIHKTMLVPKFESNKKANRNPNDSQHIQKKRGCKRTLPIVINKFFLLLLSVCGFALKPMLISQLLKILSKNLVVSYCGSNPFYLLKGYVVLLTHNWCPIAGTIFSKETVLLTHTWWKDTVLLTHNRCGK